MDIKSCADVKKQLAYLMYNDSSNIHDHALDGNVYQCIVYR